MLSSRPGLRRSPVTGASAGTGGREMHQGNRSESREVHLPRLRVAGTARVRDTFNSLSSTVGARGNRGMIVAAGGLAVSVFAWLIFRRDRKTA